MVTAMIANETTLDPEPLPSSGRRKAARISARATKPELERTSRRTGGLMSWTATLVSRKHAPQMRARPISAAYGSAGLRGRLLELDTGVPVVR